MTIYGQPEMVDMYREAQKEIECLKNLIEEIRDWDITNHMDTGLFSIPIDIRKKIASMVGDPKFAEKTDGRNT